jgi:hypothetical protein
MTAFRFCENSVPHPMLFILSGLQLGPTMGVKPMTCRLRIDGLFATDFRTTLPSAQVAAEERLGP